MLLNVNTSAAILRLLEFSLLLPLPWVRHIYSSCRKSAAAFRCQKCTSCWFAGLYPLNSDHCTSANSSTQLLQRPPRSAGVCLSVTGAHRATKRLKLGRTVFKQCIGYSEEVGLQEFSVAIGVVVLCAKGAICNTWNILYFIQIEMHTVLRA
jgi:hypothetical protein